ncbi:NAD-dependent epimerase/dehydratase family protein [Aneurinibacillus sp. Ricciae_BoGa-3]|uniref:NAD-dependent epimerase/dehydratase family protein n=1 Tax=Aneurinibacillus sp. Ricciae_BoGa-3 TaxID=3022697 RepID=UPI00233FEB46|nr:NAD-dependent epimerase/dehydratase family protein [Aneurinibacillus sp. Ricciae_BoGa-3]WCK56311.1 NAD-dependent epimerase/dehydratase family protein [Aneurinibacillus sp. Ricciae_BoGa-3]
MKSIVLGATGFIGSHVVEQLQLAGHQVTAAVRNSSDTAFLDRLRVKIEVIDYSDNKEIGRVIAGNEVVYNCIADTKSLDDEIEVKLTRNLIEAAASHGAKRFIQLSTIVIYDFQTNEPIDESYITQPEYPVQQLNLEREKVIQEVGTETGIETIILRPASTIGVRDKSSFFSRLFTSHANDRHPMINNVSTKVSFVDTRDVGRAMVWLGTYQKPEHDNGIYLLKGFDTTWKQLKIEMDQAAGKISKTVNLPDTLTDDEMLQYKLSPFALKTFTVNRIWNDSKIRKQGFETKYSLSDAVKASVDDITSRNKSMNRK